MLPKEERELIIVAGRYTYCKMKELELPLTIESYKKYLEEKLKEKRLKKKIGYREYNKMKELGLNYEEYKQYKKQQTLKKYEKKREKDKIRFRTIRYIERYCDLEMKCQICNTSERIQIHHPNYNDYLKINLLCVKHHNKLHNFELVPPTVIDLEEISIRKPAKKEKQDYITKNINDIKQDILENGFTYKELVSKYQISNGTIRRYLEKEKNWDILENKLKESTEKKRKFCNLKHQDNILQRYRIENNLTTKEFSDIAQIPIPTIRAIECGKTDIKKVKAHTKQKLKNILNSDTVQIKEGR